MLQNVCENCVRILKKEKHRQLRMFVILCEKVKETGILIDKPKRVKPKTVRTPDNIAAVAESVCEAPHRRSQQLNISEIIFSDKAHFDVGGYVNKQNCRIWGTENPHAYIEKPTHPKRVTTGGDFGP